MLCTYHTNVRDTIGILEGHVIDMLGTCRQPVREMWVYLKDDLQATLRVSNKVTGKVTHKVIYKVNHKITRNHNPLDNCKKY